MTRVQLPAPCHLCGQPSVSQRRGRLVGRLDRPAPHTDAAALQRFADHHPDLFTGTVQYLFAIGRDIAAAVTESVRLGYPLDAPLDAALSALADADTTGSAR